jgi:hypothetical protein
MNEAQGSELLSLAERQVELLTEIRDLLKVQAKPGSWDDLAAQLGRLAAEGADPLYIRDMKAALEDCRRKYPD